MVRVKLKVRVENYNFKLESQEKPQWEGEIWANSERWTSLKKIPKKWHL